MSEWLHRGCGVVLAVLIACCNVGARVDLLPLAPREARVHETLLVELAVDNPDGRAIRYRVEAPMLAAFESVTSISGSPSGGEFRWTPLASHVSSSGPHELTFVISSASGEELDRESMLVDVMAAADAAPAFLRPGAGGTHDLVRDPCVRFDVEIRDDDSAAVDIGARAAHPEGATLIAGGPKSAIFEWCPTGDQIAASERWTIELQADDGDHEPVPHDYVAVLRSGASSGCTTGSPPSIAIDTPRAGEVITSGSGYEVRVNVADDRGLRDAPLLYWSTEAPADPERPDVTTYNQIVLEADGGDAWRGRIPSLGLAEGAMADVYYLVSATDNDDAAGTTCDHRADSPLISFVAVGAASTGGDLDPCDPCTRSTECASGECVVAPGGARCLASCDSGGACTAGTCASRTTIEGGTAMACGDTSTVCGGSGAPCTDDALEPNDSFTMPAIASMPAYADLQICPGDDDFFRIDGAFGDRVSVRVEGFSHAMGDLDLRLLSSTGTILASSASTMDMESASYCLGDPPQILAQVLGYRMARNGYDLSIVREPMACCADDSFEPDDTRASARRIVGTSFEGTVCPMDDDFVAIPIAGASRVRVEILFDAAIGDVDLELQGPDGARIAISQGTTDTEAVEATLPAAGTYFARVFGFRGAANAYVGDVTLDAITTCTATAECMVSQVCESSACMSDACASAADCPPLHRCPTYGPSSAARHCGQECAVNADCRAAEACKWFPEGRACGVRGAAANGSACASAASCGGQRACLPWTGGYCARAACTTNADCESGTFCVMVSGQSACVLECESDVDRCRAAEGYVCDFVDDRAGTLHLACVPGT